jgi:glycine hydroxymethyltransferase
MFELPDGYFREVYETDADLGRVLEAETRRQRDTIEMNPGENYVSPAVLKAMASPMTNKYADGYPGRRLFRGCEHVDAAEQLAIDRLKALFGADHANVQANSGGDTNMAVYYAALEPGDTVLGPNLLQGGQASHGSPKNFSGRFFRYVYYDLDPETERLDYDRILEAAKVHRPKLIISGASSYSRRVNHRAFRDIADRVGAYYLADVAQVAGLVAAGLLQNPVPYADFVTASTHKTMRGPRGGFILCRAEHAQRIDDAVWPGTQGSPSMHIIAAKAVCFREAMEEPFRAYQRQVVKNAQVLADALQAGGVHVITRGTDTHIVTLDTVSKGRPGHEALDLLDRCGIIATRYRLISETPEEGRFGGLRLGTSCVTTRGFLEPDMEALAGCFLDVIRDGGAAVEDVSRRVKALCDAHPIYVS